MLWLCKKSSILKDQKNESALFTEITILESEAFVCWIFGSPDEHLDQLFRDLFNA